MANTSWPVVALGFVGQFDSGDDLQCHRQAHVSGDEGGFEFFERRCVQFR